MKSIIYSFLLMALPFHLMSQEDFICKDLDHLMDMEMTHHSQLIGHRVNTLTQNYDIKYHRLTWEVDPAVSYIRGRILTYFVPATTDFDQINFDLVDGMIINSINYHGVQLTHNLSGDNLQIDLPGTISIGSLDSIEVVYEGAPDNSGFGAFAIGSHYGEPTLWTLSEPYGAKSWWPCKQDLNDKIDSIDIFVTTPELFRVGSNGLLVSQSNANNKTTYHWRHRYPIPAYLISIAVANYDTFTDYVYRDDGDSIPILNYVYSGNLQNAQAQLANTVDIMTFYNEKFGLYPFADEKYGHAQFGWGGGMEHQTMSSMGGFSYNLQAHELAHQWFGDKVTCGSWQDIWLNEGFATYLAALTLEFITPNPNDWNNWKTVSIQTITNFPGGSTFVDDTTSVSRIFNSRLTYTKGSMILHMLRWKLGDEDFFQAVQNYLNDPQLAYGYARTVNLKAHLEVVSGMDLTEFLADWFYGSGHPSYMIDYTPLADGINFSISQTTSDPSVDFFEMPVPIKVFGGGRDTILIANHTASGQSFHFDLPFAPESIEFDPDQWLISRNNSINLISATKESERLATHVNIYPNPVDDILHIEFDQTWNSMYIEAITLSDMSGRTILKTSDLKSVMQIETSELNSGLYVLTFNSKAGVFVKLFGKL